MGLIKSLMQWDADMARIQASEQEKAALRAEKKAEADRAQRVRELEAQRKIRPLVEDAYKNLGDNPSDLKKAVGDIFKAYEMETGTTVDPEIVKVFGEPEFGSQLLDASKEAGATLGDVIAGGKQPLLRAEARIALASRANARKVQEATIGTPPQGGETPAPAAEPLGEGQPLRVAGDAAAQGPVTPKTAAVAPSGQPAAGVAPRASLKPAVDAIDTQIGTIEARRAAAVRANATPQQTAVFDQQLKDLRDRRAKLTEGVEQTAVEADVRRRAEALPTDVTRETRTFTRGELEDAGGANLRTPNEVAAQSAAIAAAETDAGKARGEIRQVAEQSRRQIPIFQRTSAVLETAGRTGAVIGPLRQGIGQALQLVLPDSRVNSIMKLSDVELLNQANIEFALAGLKDVGGNDTERELVTLMRSKPGILNSQQANRFATRWALASHERNLERDNAAEKWIADRETEGKPASLRSRNRDGKTFNQRWDEYVNKRSLFTRVARDLGLDPVDFAASIGYDRDKAAGAFGSR